ncbi:unnamed protein product [Urochloa decumbens]|uniref:DUF6598 domain-containing protein n=1 Tax=Urochloa decumbens TaxID=240449 RepID=A0ABC9CX23_9POAL
MSLDVQFKRDHEVEGQAEDEAAKKMKVELDAVERKRLAEAEGVAKFIRFFNTVEDEEELTDYYAAQAKQLRKFWESLYHGRYGYFEDESPSRAVNFGDPVILEVELKVKSNTESEDRVLNFLAPRLKSPAFAPDSSMFKKCYTSKLSTLEFTVGHIFYSLEATISVKVIEGSWLGDCRAQFAASTASIEDEEVVLLGLGDEKVPLDGDNILLSRCVVSVELEGQLIVSASVRRSKEARDETVEDHAAFFTPFKMGRSYGELNVGFCKIEVTVAWSLF